MTTKTKQRKPATRKSDARSAQDFALRVGKAPEHGRGLMGKMVEYVQAHRGATRATVLKHFLASKQPRARIVKNLAWGLRHGVFKVN